MICLSLFFSLLMIDKSINFHSIGNENHIFSRVYPEKYL
jgi:hypothetical protein